MNKKILENDNSLKANYSQASNMLMISLKNNPLIQRPSQIEKWNVTNDPLKISATAYLPFHIMNDKMLEIKDSFWKPVSRSFKNLVIDRNIQTGIKSKKNIQSNAAKNTPRFLYEYSEINDHANKSEIKKVYKVILDPQDMIVQGIYVVRLVCREIGLDSWNYFEIDDDDSDSDVEDQYKFTVGQLPYHDLTEAVEESILQGTNFTIQESIYTYIHQDSSDVINKVNENLEKELLK